MHRALFVNSFVPCFSTGERFSIVRQQHRTAHNIDDWFSFSAAPILQFCFVLFYFVSSSAIHSSSANFRINSNVIYFVCNCINFNEAPRAYINCSMLGEREKKKTNKTIAPRQRDNDYLYSFALCSEGERKREKRERKRVFCVCFILSPRRYLKTFNVLIGFI